MYSPELIDFIAECLDFCTDDVNEVKVFDLGNNLAVIGGWDGPYGTNEVLENDWIHNLKDNHYVYAFNIVGKEPYDKGFDGYDLIYDAENVYDATDFIPSEDDSPEDIAFGLDEKFGNLCDMLNNKYKYYSFAPNGRIIIESERDTNE